MIHWLLPHLSWTILIVFISSNHTLPSCYIIKFCWVSWCQSRICKVTFWYIFSAKLTLSVPRSYLKFWPKSDKISNTNISMQTQWENCMSVHMSHITNHYEEINVWNKFSWLCWVLNLAAHAPKQNVSTTWLNLTPAECEHILTIHMNAFYQQYKTNLKADFDGFIETFRGGTI